MRIQYQNYLHLEFEAQGSAYNLPNVNADVIVLAGDIGKTGQRCN
jgi:hypothetical protein